MHQNDMWFIQAEIVGQVAVHWHQLGIDLGIETYVLDRIKKDNPVNPEGCCKLMFNELCNKGNVTYQDVIESLYDLKLGYFADEISERLSRGATVRPPISVVRETISLPAVDKVLTTEDLASLANLTGMLSANWDSLASYLIGSHKVEEIKVDCRGSSADAMNKVWEAWVNTAEEDKRTLMYLMRAVTTIGLGSAADDIGRKCTPPYSEKIEKIVLRLPLLEPLRAENKAALYNIVLEKLGARWDNLGIMLGSSQQNLPQ